MNHYSNMSKETPTIQDSQATHLFKTKTETAMAKIMSYKTFEESDPMVKLVMDTGRSLFAKNLDQMGVDLLLRLGGKLVGAYPYIGQQASYARAERDVYEQKATEFEKERMLYWLDESYKVTEARSRVSAEMSEIRDFVIQKDRVKNAWENILEACQTMSMFIQSAIKIKQSERFASKQLHDNG